MPFCPCRPPRGDDENDALAGAAAGGDAKGAGGGAKAAGGGAKGTGAKGSGGGAKAGGGGSSGLSFDADTRDG